MIDSDYKVKNYLIKNRKYAKQAICKNYPFTFAELKNYEELLDWDTIATNHQINWNSDIINYYKHKLDWEILTTNQSIFKNLDLIDEFSTLIHWQDPHQSFFSTIANNKGIYWTNELILKYENQLDFYQLSYNENVEWSEKLIDRYVNKWDWVQLGGLENLPWSISFFEKYKDRLQSNYFGFKTNPTLTSNIEFIEKYYHLLEPWAIFENEKLPWYEKNLLERWEDLIDWYGVAGNKLLLNDSDFLYANMDRWIHLVPKAFNMLSRNTGIKWSIELIEKYKPYWDWKLLSQNESLPWSIEFIEHFKNDLLWGEVIVHDQYFDEYAVPVYDHEMIFEEVEQYMTSNPSLPWSFDFLMHFGNSIDPETLSTTYPIWQKIFKPHVTPVMVNDIITNYWSLKYLSTHNKN